MPLRKRELRLAETQQRIGRRSRERCEERGTGWAGMWRIPFKDTLVPLSRMEWHNVGPSYAAKSGEGERSEGCKIKKSGFCDEMEKRREDSENSGLTFALKALLIRHETYVAEAESSRREHEQKIEHLQKDKHNLEIENHRLIDENKDLSNQVEDLNNEISESDIRIDSLKATLNATHMEMRRLENLAVKTSNLEAQLLELEREQEELRQIITHSEAEEKAAIRRWKAAEKKVVDLQDQLEKIESEAYDEKLRHEEVLRRMERQKAVDRELQSGKATVSAKSGPNVVSHFVKDILQDNVNLQMGIVELREMLMSSNDEVQKLRDQLNGCGPAEEEDEPRTKRIESTLDTELAAKEPLASSPALHVHHHYHVPKAQDVRRAVPKKKRSVALLDRGMHSRNSSRHRHQPRQPSIASTILSQTSMTIPSPMRPQPNQRWSMQSYNAPSEFASSAPSSPQEYRSSVLFDRMSIDQSMEYSRPTSPEMSEYAMSPNFRPQHKRKVSEQSNHSSRNISPRGQQMYQNDTIHEEEDDDIPVMAALEEASRSPITQDDSALGLESERADAFDPFASSHGFQPKLRRSNSHESILSISGQDIHTLKTRPSQMGIANPSSRIGLTTRSSYTNLGTSSAVLSTVDAFGTGELSAATTIQTRIDSRSLLRSTAGLPERPMTAKSANSATSSETVTAETTKKQGGGGGWIRGLWGMKPTSQPSSTSSTPAQSRAASCVDVHPPPNAQMKKLAARAMSMPVQKLKDEEKDQVKSMLGRSPGINVAGPVPGWRVTKKAPSQVVPLRVDFEALREVLEEDR